MSEALLMAQFIKQRYASYNWHAIYTSVSLCEWHVPVFLLFSIIWFSTRWLIWQNLQLTREMLRSGLVRAACSQTVDVFFAKWFQVIHNYINLSPKHIEPFKFLNDAVIWWFIISLLQLPTLTLISTAYTF